MTAENTTGEAEVTQIWFTTDGTTKMIGVPICPDLLEYGDIGVADNLRGRMVRAFFWFMRVWPV